MNGSKRLDHAANPSGATRSSHVSFLSSRAWARRRGALAAESSNPPRQSHGAGD
jgi:hypothetical protein